MVGGPFNYCLYADRARVIFKERVNAVAYIKADSKVGGKRKRAFQRSVGCHRSAQAELPSAVLTGGPTLGPVNVVFRCLLKLLSVMLFKHSKDS